MEENEYRSTYRTINERRCIFEKGINSRRCSCQQMARFNLADREGVACNSETAHRHCQQFIELMRQNASFALQLTRVEGALPHAKEIKVQTGGLLGLQKLLVPELAESEKVEDIAGLLQQALEKYHHFSELPFTEIIKSIVSFEGRSRRPKKS